MNDREIMQQALGIIIELYNDRGEICHQNKELFVVADKTIAALEAELSKPEQELDYPPECTTPEMKLAYAAGWWKALEVQRQQALDKKADNARELGLVYEPEQKFVDIHCPSCLHSFSVVPVAKREWVSLTDDEVDDIASNVGFGYMDMAKGVEAKLREKNT